MLTNCEVTTDKKDKTYTTGFPIGFSLLFHFSSPSLSVGHGWVITQFELVILSQPGFIVDVHI